MTRAGDLAAALELPARPAAYCLRSEPLGSLGELAQAQEPIEREEQQVSTETNERDEERTEQAGSGHGNERDQSARRIGVRAASTTDRGERVTPGSRHPATAADHRNQSARATSITPADLPANPHGSGYRGEKTSRAQSWP